MSTPIRWSLFDFILLKSNQFLQESALFVLSNCKEGVNDWNCKVLFFWFWTLWMTFANSFGWLVISYWFKRSHLLWLGYLVVVSKLCFVLDLVDETVYIDRQGSKIFGITDKLYSSWVLVIWLLTHVNGLNREVPYCSCQYIYCFILGWWNFLLIDFLHYWLLVFWLTGC